MRVELLIVTDCPNKAAAYERLRQALDEAGRETTPIVIRTLTDATVGEFPGFAGSPTVMIDGADPFANPDSPTGTGMSCRVYRSEGGVGGAPSLDDLRRAVGHRQPR